MVQVGLGEPGTQVMQLGGHVRGWHSGQQSSDVLDTGARPGGHGAQAGVWQVTLPELQEQTRQLPELHTSPSCLSLVSWKQRLRLMAHSGQQAPGLVTNSSPGPHWLYSHLTSLQTTWASLQAHTSHSLMFQTDPGACRTPLSNRHQPCFLTHVRQQLPSSLYGFSSTWHCRSGHCVS